jgi:hypothetical protein
MIDGSVLVRVIVFFYDSNNAADKTPGDVFGDRVRISQIDDGSHIEEGGHDVECHREGRALKPIQLIPQRIY